MKNLNEFNNLTIDFSKMTPIEDVRETLILSEELLEKYKIVIDESKIEQIIAEIPEEQRHTLTLEEKLEYIKNILSYDVSIPIKNLFDDVISFVSKL
jgi:hypothetical protein